MWPSKPGMLLSLARSILLAQRALADCECGYSTTVGSSTHDTQQQQQQQHSVFTDLVEANFANMSDISKNTDWVRQEFNTSAEQARGDYGEMFAVDNVQTRGGDGLQITVKSGTVEGMLSGGEMDTARRDVFYGTFRSSVRLTGVGGTVSALFWYFNDTQEIDMEFLSKDFDAGNSSFPVNLVLQPPSAAQAGLDASGSGTGSHKVAYLPFDPSTGFHEYRFDFVPGRVVFYADGEVLAAMEDAGAMPTAAGHLALSQWSNGNPLWSGGPPAGDAVMQVRYVKAYFNSSEEARQGDFAARCVDPTAAGAVCAIPAVTAADDTAAGFFFTGQRNSTANQTVSPDNGVGGGDENGAVGGPGLPHPRGALGWCVLCLSLWLAGGLNV